MAQRLVLIDDTNTNIQYSGPWVTAENTLLNMGNNGPPFQNTLHSFNDTTVDRTPYLSFSFSFRGSSVTVMGTNIPLFVPNGTISAIQASSWQCFVDNDSIGDRSTVVLPSSSENNLVFCQSSHLQDGPHVLSVNVTMGVPPIWFDQIQYLPSSDISLDQSIVRVDSSDPAIQYSSGWKENSPNATVNYTQTAGSTVTYEFSGVSLSWMGQILPNISSFSSQAVYSIDGQAPILFPVPALPASDPGATLYNQVLFKTGTLSAGQHKVIVTHRGGSGRAPLTLDYFVVQNATSPSATSALTGVPAATSIIPSSVPSSSSSNSMSNLGSKKLPPVGLIIGAVIGITLLLLLLLLFYIRRRKNRRARRLSDKSYLHDSRYIMYPFIVPPSDLPPSFPSPNHTSDGQSLTQPFANKPAERKQPIDTSSTPSNITTTSPLTNPPSPGSGGGMSPSRNHSATASPPSFGLPLAAAQIGGAMAKSREAETAQRSASSHDGGVRFLRHEDSGVRIPPTRDSLVELPPMYTPG